MWVLNPDQVAPLGLELCLLATYYRGFQICTNLASNQLKTPKASILMHQRLRVNANSHVWVTNHSSATVDTPPPPKPQCGCVKRTLQLGKRKMVIDFGLSLNDVFMYSLIHIICYLKLKSKYTLRVYMWKRGRGCSVNTHTHVLPLFPEIMETPHGRFHPPFPRL